MKKITMIKMEGCPYCAAAFKAIDELKKNYAAVEIEVIDKYFQAQLAEKFTDYYYVPSMYVDGKKIYEAHPGESYDECFANVKKVFEAAYE
ncbi:MAG: glutaredoxin family protein [Selenomonadaceae bacterium]|nr:glutaredoxin family protein [Selenomonadaceae bacterium]